MTQHPRIETECFRIRGLHCAEEVAVLKSVLAPQAGVRELAFDVLHGKMVVTFDPSAIAATEIIAAVATTGLHAVPWDEREHTPAEQVRRSERIGPLIANVGSGVLLLAAWLAHALQSGWRAALGLADVEMPLLPRVLFLVATGVGGIFVLPKAFLAARSFRPDMHLLMTVAVAGAIGLGELSEAATVVFLFAVSLSLEAWSVGRARRAIHALMTLAPDTACLLQSDGTEAKVPADTVIVGDTLIVRPGERFPLDGKVVKGATTVDEAPITGESLPVVKTLGSDVFAGTINADGAVEILTTKVASDTTLAHILRIVGDAQRHRSRGEQWVEKFARVYTPAVMALAGLVMLLPPLFLSHDWSSSFYEGLVLLVIACPCALVISTPVCIVAALTSAANAGVLVKGGQVLELAAQLRAVAIDKTGTLTLGQPDVREVIPFGDSREADVLAMAAAIEARSQHPLAQAIVRKAHGAGVAFAPVEDFQSLPGRGAEGLIAGRRVWVGSLRFLEDLGRSTTNVCPAVEELTAHGDGVIAVCDAEQIRGLIAFTDALRPEAASAVRALRAAGIEHIVMLTGDHRRTAEVLAQQVGVDEVRAELLPQAKAERVEELVHRFGQVAMIGDGVNDAPALARATVGIAMGVAGTDAALETADIALMGDDLTRVAWLIHHARWTRRIIRQNVIAALGVKAAFAVLTVFGLASLWTAIAADTGMSLLVVFNALRLLKDTVPESPHEGRIFP